MMQKEIDSAVQFVCGLLRARSMSLDLVEAFRTVLCEIMYGRYEGHWFPEKPFKGSAYRCMRINDRNIDPLILKACDKVGMTLAQMLQVLPNQLTIWVDPHEVAYRIGEDGSIGVLYDANASPIQPCDDDDSGGSAAGSTKSSPSQSPVPSSTDDDLSPTSPRVPQYTGGGGATCRQEMLTQQEQLLNQRSSRGLCSGGSDSNSSSSSSTRNGSSNGSSSGVSSEQFLNPVLIASS